MALAVSDTHGNAGKLDQIALEYKKFEYLFHLGDNVRDALYLEQKMPDTKVTYVKGNCDVGSDAPEFCEMVLKGNRIILTHGHTLKVKYSYDRALYYAKEHEARAILFGHTHVAYTEYIDGIWLINPGSAGDERREDMSVCVLVVSEAGIVPKLVKL